VLPVHLVKYLSRESRKLAVMIWRGLLSDLATYYKSLVIYSVLYEGLFFAQSCDKGILVRMAAYAPGAST